MWNQNYVELSIHEAQINNFNLLLYLFLKESTLISCHFEYEWKSTEQDIFWLKTNLQLNRSKN